MNTRNRILPISSPFQNPRQNHINPTPQLNDLSFMQPANTPLQITSSRSRKQTPIFLFFINLSMPIALTGLNLSIFLSIQNRSNMISYLLIGVCLLGLLFSIWQSLLLANWRDILRLYFVLDSLLPVLIAGFLGLYTLLNFMRKGQWYEYCFSICFPIWLFYFAGYLRVIIAYGAWKRWQVIVYKLTVVSCGLGFFYIGVYYMNGGYKITNGMMPELQQKMKNLVLLYVFGNNELFFQYYRRISDFDQTEELQYSYQFREDKDSQRANTVIDFENKLFKEQPQRRVQMPISKAREAVNR